MTPSVRASRRQLLGSLGALALAGLAGCEGDEPRPPMRVGSIVFPGYELMFLARELGLLSAREVRLIELSSNSDAVRALAVGKLEAAALTLDELLTARAEGVELVAVLVLDISHGADVVLARPPLRDLSDLRGQRVGVDDSAGGVVMLGALLEAAGLGVADVRKVSLTLDQGPTAWAGNAVDVLVTAEPWAQQIEQTGAVRLLDSAALPGRIVDVLAVRRDALTPYDRALRHLVSAHLAALAHWNSRPLDAAPLLARRLQLEATEVARAFHGLQLPDLAHNRRLLGAGPAQTPGLQAPLQALMDVMLAQSLLARRVALDGFLDARFLPAT